MGAMNVRIGAIIPYRPDPRKSRILSVLKQCREVCDCTFILHDRMYSPLPLPVTEQVTVAGGYGWSDWANRLTLMVRAKKYDCDFVMQIDDDEELGPTLTRKRVKNICQQMIEEGAAETIVRVRTMWNDTHWRTDGIFGGQLKSFFLLNPFSVSPIKFEWGFDKRLHHFPNLIGPKMMVNDWIVHHGMNSPELRRRNIEKYEAADTKQEFSGIPYNYLLNESGITLQKL